MERARERKNAILKMSNFLIIHNGKTKLGIGLDNIRFLVPTETRISQILGIILMIITRASLQVMSKGELVPIPKSCIRMCANLSSQ